MTEIVINAKSAEQLLGDVQAMLPKSLARALNRGILAARTVLVRNVGRDIGLRQGDVRDAIRMLQASPTRLVARLSTGLVRIPLIDFKAKGPVPSRGKGRGVTYRIGSERRRAPHAFITTVGTGRHTGVFHRVGKDRLPIRELFGPSLGHVFLTYEDEARARGEEQFEKTLLSDLKFRTRPRKAA